MNTSIMISVQDKVKHVNEMLQKLSNKVSNKEDKTLQLLRINFITFLDESIEKLEQLGNDSPSTFNVYSQNHSDSNTKNQLQQFKERYFQSEKERTVLEKKLTDLLQKRIQEQQQTLKLERAQSESLKQKYKLESQLKQQQQINEQLQHQINNLSLKIKDQDKEMHRLVSLNHKLNDQKQYIVNDRNRTQKKLNQLIEKYEDNDLDTHTRAMKGYEKFNIKNTQGIKIIRTLTNISNEKKNNEKYFVVELPAKIELHKIVYGIRIGAVSSNKEITYFNDLHLYEKDPMILTQHGENLAIQYIKRRQKVVVEKIRLTKPQILILLYGKGDSVMIDETK